jgi:hypothetical protein
VSCAEVWRLAVRVGGNQIASVEAAGETESRMRRVWIVFLGLFVPAAVLVAGSGAVTQVPSGDTCTATGTGTSYTLTITIPAGGTEQGGFAFGAPGGTVTNIVMPATQGALSTTNIPANTTAAWLLNAAVVPGQTYTATLATSGTLTGPFTVIPANRDRTEWFDPVACTVMQAVVPSNKFTAQTQVAFHKPTGTWREIVTVPGPGKLNYVHTTLATSGTPKPLVKSGIVIAKGAGKVTLILRPTPAGLAQLSASGVIRLNLNIQFSPTGGKPANKIVTLALKR